MRCTAPSRRPKSTVLNPSSQTRQALSAQWLRTMSSQQSSS